MGSSPSVPNAAVSQPSSSGSRSPLVKLARRASALSRNASPRAAPDNIYKDVDKPCSRRCCQRQCYQALLINHCEGGCTVKELCLCGNYELWEAQQALATCVSSYNRLRPVALTAGGPQDLAMERTEANRNQQAEIMQMRELVLAYIDKPGRASSKLRVLDAALGPIYDSKLLALVKDGTVARMHDYRVDFQGALTNYFWTGAAMVASVFTAGAIIVVGEQVLLARLCQECDSRQQGMVVAGLVLLPLATCIGLWVAIGGMSMSRENYASSRLTACSKELQKAVLAAAVGPVGTAVAGAGGAVVAGGAVQAPAPQVMDLLHGLQADVKGLRDLIQIVIDGQEGGDVGAVRQAAAEVQQQATAEGQKAADEGQQAAGVGELDDE